jgi:flavin-dependent dehydrogenase
MRERDVVIVGGGLAGLAAAQKLNHLDLEILAQPTGSGAARAPRACPTGPG